MSITGTDERSYEASLWARMPKVSPPRAVRGTIVTILGCGTSSGVPLLACECETCRSRDSRNSRSRASVSIQAGATTFLIDTSPDLRAQAFATGLRWIDAVLYTHPHADHIHGIDDLRSFNFIMARRILCFSNRRTIDTIREKFDYIFNRTQAGGGKPLIDLHVIAKRRKISGVHVQPIELIHGRMQVLGYRINAVAYVTDCSYIPDRSFKHLRNLDVLVLDCLRFTPHTTHLNVEQALDLARKIGARRTYFTHMGHEIEYRKFARSLPKGMFPSYDGLVIRSS